MKPMFIGKLFTILSFALALCFSLLLVPTQAIAEIDKSKLIKQKGILKTDGSKSSASIFIGASSDNGATTSDNFLYSENVLIEAVIEFDTDDVGKSGDIFVVMRKGSGKSKVFYALNDSNSWEVWGGSLKTLPAAKSIEKISERERLEIFTGKLDLGQSTIYVGYSTQSENTKPIIHVNGVPQKLTSYKLPTISANYSKYEGETCVDGLADYEVDGIELKPNNPDANEWNCNVVNDALNNPTRTGKQTLRFELRDGDCSISFSGYDDCENDRSRVELYETWPGSSDVGKIVRYSHSLFIPYQPDFYTDGLPISIFAQVASDNDTEFTQLLYLHTTDGENLMIRFHEGWTFTGDDFVISTELYDVWHDITYELSGGLSEDNYIRVYLNGQLVAENIRETFADDTGFFTLKVGIYDPFVSRVTEEIMPKFLFHDAISKKYLSD